MTINRRLVLLVAVPLLVALTFSVLALAPATNQALQAHRLTTMVEAAQSAAELTHRLQRERAAATALVAGQGEAEDFSASSQSTDRGLADFRGLSGDLASVPDKARGALDRIKGSLEELPSLRAQARSGESSLSALAFGYRIVITNLIDYRDGIALSDGLEAGIADRIRAAAALSRAAEHIGRQQVTVQRALAAGGFTPASLRTFDATRLGYTDSTAVLFDLGPRQWRTWLERALSGPKSQQAQRLEDEIGRSEPGKELDVSTDDWLAATSDRLDLLRGVEKRVDDSLHDTVTDTRTELAWWAIAEAVLVLLTLFGAVFVAFRLGRVMIRRLRDLRTAAHEVANTTLPQVVAQLSKPGALRGASPEEVAQNSGRPVEATSKDEIGEVGKAFNAVHFEAVRLAAEQARFHEQFAETLVGVARRGAQLTSVMVRELDTVQRDEADPERMQTLFALDHLAIRMERNTNNLLVLGGYGHGRVRSDDVPCSTVILVAAQQIEQFGRVRLGVVEKGIGVAARVVHDVAHILAELLDNATNFSPPGTHVGVAVWRLHDRAVVQVVDEGVGMPPERRARCNAALASTRTDIGDVRAMGLHVVARLARRHGIAVELRDGAPGIIAEVTLPTEILTEIAEETTPVAPEVFQERPRSGPAAPPRPAIRATAEDPAPAPAVRSGEDPAEAPRRAAPAARDPFRTERAASRTAPDRQGQDQDREPWDHKRPEEQRAREPWDHKRPEEQQDRPARDHERSAEDPGHPAEGPARPAPSWARTPATVGPPRGGPPRPPGGERPQEAARPGERDTGGEASARFSKSGLPVRQKGGSMERPLPGAARAEGTEPRPGAARPGTARPAKPAPRRRDSRQVSDVFAAYTQGISRSNSRRNRPADADRTDDQS
ncbi:putative sensor-like histidine kinase [Streptomyces albus]|uniref:histidine kinase n=1 Tax=Streptomyces albus (strain ATCC 21838 / DSM 41398 / FERM P-419 / JCM 4703 / NBRC 107858) TaxID=1081613 RepID=A0A0B5EWW5_STRA4|nr:putative sensor-like histidine kinase [Streptomyces albus]AOU78007.1 putative sensor-like histidine kinase [Streptomyces albus]AYN33762.1 histidine kinase [Streptomyces albus]